MAHGLYRKIYEKQADFYRKRRWARRALNATNYTLAFFVATTYAVFCVAFLSLNSTQSKDFARLLAVPAVCFLFVSALRLLFDRPRPYQSDITPVLRKKKTGKSFPSRHVASAFVIGTVLLGYLPPLGVGVLIAGMGTAYVRFAAGLHYPSDLLAGALLGAAFGALSFL